MTTGGFRHGEQVWVSLKGDDLIDIAFFESAGRFGVVAADQRSSGGRDQVEVDHAGEVSTVDADLVSRITPVFLDWRRAYEAHDRNSRELAEVCHDMGVGFGDVRCRRTDAWRAYAAGRDEVIRIGGLLWPR